MLILYHPRRNMQRQWIFRDRMNPLEKYGHVVYCTFGFSRCDIFQLIDEMREAIKVSNSRLKNTE